MKIIAGILNYVIPKLGRLLKWLSGERTSQ